MRESKPEGSQMQEISANPRLFILFRVLFNGRFYYPIFAILFLDFGLTMEQFGLLNAVWAVAIVALEVPSGVLADVLGRRRLVVMAGSLMVVEMLILCFVPLGNAELVFWALVLNRALSGAAEAMASGADEALAYDSLPAEDREEQWAHVLEKTMRCQSAFMVFAMLIGAAIYDPRLVQYVTDCLGMSLELSQQDTLRFPLYLNLATAVATLAVALKMTELPAHSATGEQAGKSLLILVEESFIVTFTAGKWILKTRFALALILVALFHDSVIRLFLTISSSYYRLIELPECTLGLIGAALTGIGLFLPRYAKLLHQTKPPWFNFLVTAAFACAGLLGVSFVWPIYGVAYSILLYAGIMLTHFFLSNYLNAIVAPERRATVLSFKGLAMNLGYGSATLLFGLAVERIRSSIAAQGNFASEQAIKDASLVEFLQWLPGYFLAGCFVLALYLYVTFKGQDHWLTRVPEGNGNQSS